MKTATVVDWLAKRLRSACSLVVILMGSIAPLFLIPLKRMIESYEPIYTRLGAKLPLPMRLFNDVPYPMIYLAWAIIILALLAALVLEEYEAKNKQTNRSIPGSPELLAIATIAFVLTLCIIEQPFINACQQASKDAATSDMMLRHLQKYHQKAG